jgi:hypothetical protein
MSYHDREKLQRCVKRLNESLSGTKPLDARELQNLLIIAFTSMLALTEPQPPIPPQDARWG